MKKNTIITLLSAILSNVRFHGGEELPAGTFHGGEELPAGTFHGGEELPAGTFHGGEELPAGTFHKHKAPTPDMSLISEALLPYI